MLPETKKLIKSKNIYFRKIFFDNILQQLTAKCLQLVCGLIINYSKQNNL